MLRVHDGVLHAGRHGVETRSQMSCGYGARCDRLREWAGAYSCCSYEVHDASSND
jgi:hypothetical protein